MKDKKPLTIAVTALNAIDSPGPGVAVIRSIREGFTEPVRIIGLSYEALEPGIYMDNVVDKTYQIPYPAAGTQALLERLQYIHEKENIDVLIPNFDAELYKEQFIEAMDDDFNTPKALAILFDLAREINQAADSGIGFQDAKEVLLSLGQEVLGLELPETRIILGKASFKGSGKLSAKATVVNTHVNRLIEERAGCREHKNWQQADAIRSKLAELGVILEDTKSETKIISKSVPSKESLDNLMKELGIDFQDTPTKDS